MKVAGMSFDVLLPYLSPSSSRFALFRQTFCSNSQHFIVLP